MATGSGDNDEGRIMKTAITLPLSEAEREAIPSILAVCDAALKEFCRIESRAWAEYAKAFPALSYGEARKAAWAEYGEARKAAWAEYDKVRDAACAEYVKTRDASPLVAWIIRTFLDDRKDEAVIVLEALADGATMADLATLAGIEGWCHEWRNALTAASELFDIR